MSSTNLILKLLYNIYIFNIFRPSPKNDQEIIRVEEVKENKKKKEKEK